MNYLMCFVMTFQFAIFARELRAGDEIEDRKKEPRISRKYYRGSYLIYDCEDQHYACVNRFSWGLCRGWRKQGLDKKEIYLKCAPLKKFETQKDCFAEQTRQIHNQKYKRFCRGTII